MATRRDPLDRPTRHLQVWMRTVGGFYVVLGLFNTPPVIVARFPAQYPSLGVAIESRPAQALLDVWFMFGLEVAVIGVVLMIAARDPVRHIVLVWTVLALEIVRGIADDLYMLTRGYDVAPYVIWIALHTVVVASGLWALRRAQLHMLDEPAWARARSLERLRGHGRRRDREVGDTGSGVRPGDEVAGADVDGELVQRTSHQPEVDRADDVLMLSGDLEEGTAAQDDLGAVGIVAVELGREPEPVEQVHQLRDRCFSVGLAEGGGRVDDEAAPGVPGPLGGG